MTGFIVPCNLKYAPYVNYYIDIYKKNGLDFEIITWDKKGLTEDVDYSFHYEVKDSDRKRMMLGYLQYVRFVKKICKKKKYDKLIVYTIAPAVFMASFLTKKYDHNYILDIRDDSPFVRKTPALFHKVRDAAADVVSSSPLFFDWIEKECYLCHNCDIEKMKIHHHDELTFNSELPVKIVFAGMMNESNINQWMLEQVAEDGVFEFSFWGPMSDTMKDIETKAKALNLNTVHFGGTYNKDDIVSIYRENSDFVNIIRKNCTVNKNALPNKLYDAVMAGKPVIVFKHNEAVARYVEKYNLGIVLDDADSNSVKISLRKKIEEFSFERYREGRSLFIDAISQDQANFESMVEDFARKTKM